MSDELILEGIAASPGIAIGLPRVIHRIELNIPKQAIDSAKIDEEIERLQAAVAESRQQLLAAKDALSLTQSILPGDHAMILDAHLLMIEDGLLINGAIALIRHEFINAEWAYLRKANEIRDSLAGIADAYFRDRAFDVEFICHRVLRNLLGHATDIIGKIDEPCIVLAGRLSPVETTQMIGSAVLAFATSTGTRTSHTSIMAQALGIPAVVGLVNLPEHISPQQPIIVDGTMGRIILAPSPSTLKEYEARAVRYAEFERRLLVDRERPAVTADGEQVSLLANIEFPAEAAVALEYGAQGIGLFRTEFLYLNRPNLPDEEEQLTIYRTVVSTVAPREVVFRTFDLGADKLSTAAAAREINPALGLRAIRLGLRDLPLFKTQLRALLRASQQGPMGIMFPMVSGVGELRQLKALLEETRLSLGKEAPLSVRIGCMIELPSAAMVADQLAKEVDFFSIGTNDLIQYSLAIDRDNDHVAYLYTPFHPGILRLVKRVINAGNQAGIQVSMCGSLASEPLIIPLLIGMGLRSFSMAPTSLPYVKEILRSIHSQTAKDLADQAINLPTAEDVEGLIRSHFDQTDWKI